MMKSNTFFALALALLFPIFLQAQLPGFTNDQHTRADSLRGTLTPLRSCYDVNYYHLDVKVDIPNRAIAGSNLIQFTATEDFEKLQFDLFDDLKIDYIQYHGEKLPYKREFNAVFVAFPKTIKKGSLDAFQVFYSGRPRQANRAPWDGGFDWKIDSQGKPWVATACQGLGASAWWPNKDHQSDEVDSMLISVAVPSALMNISNGRLRSTEKLKGGYTKYNWFVANPINNYNVALNIGDYVNLKDSYTGEKGVLDIDYYVLRENKDRAFNHLSKNTKDVLQALEHWFGPYPWYEDGYKLVETSHLGMEHQSAIAYGNKYMNGYLGRDGSGTGYGNKWDFIIIHESGHEWFGNNITAKDLADMWIHESFTNYSESLFIEYFYGKQAAQDYLYGNRKGILNDRPLYGIPNVNKSGSGDMYLKGGVLMNQVRTIINDDRKWSAILRGLNTKFYHKTVDYKDIVGYITAASGIDFNPIFEQYVRFKTLPTLDVYFDQEGKIYGRWNAEATNFTMPIAIQNTNGSYEMVTITNKYRPLGISGLTKNSFKIDEQNFYIGLLIQDFQYPKK